MADSALLAGGETLVERFIAERIFLDLAAAVRIALNDSDAVAVIAEDDNGMAVGAVIEKILSGSCAEIPRWL